MKQTIKIRRVEERVIELDVPQTLRVDTLTELANAALSGVGSPAFGRCVSATLSDWSVLKAEPSGECERAARVAKRRGRK